MFPKQNWTCAPMYIVQTMVTMMEMMKTAKISLLCTHVLIDWDVVGNYDDNSDDYHHHLII